MTRTKIEVKHETDGRIYTLHNDRLYCIICAPAVGARRGNTISADIMTQQETKRRQTRSMNVFTPAGVDNAVHEIAAKMDRPRTTTDTLAMFIWKMKGA
jgi:hypothetical protein